MASEKIKAIQTGTKSKEKNGKFGKIKFPKRDNIINPDLSNLRKPIDTSISTLYHISKLLENSTEEVKSILTYECDIIYECRTCRSLFRSIANLISHKREYCREKFNITLHKNKWDDYNTISAIAHSAINTCQAEQAIIKTNLTNNRILRSQVSKETCKKDLTAVIDVLLKKQENMKSSYNESNIEGAITDTLSNQHVYLRTIGTNDSTIYQTIESSDIVANAHTNLTAKEGMEFQNTMEQNDTMLEEHRNGNQSEKSDSPVQIDPSDEETLTNSLVCAICSAKFSTKKTLTFHVRTLHTSQRMHYTCPCCTSTFANTWSVHRHLFKVHKKNHEQVRKLRLKIQEVPFNREAIVIQDLKKNRATRTAVGKIKYNNELGHSDKPQERISSLESNNSSCNGCEQKFDTKTALSAHSQHCQALIATCNQITTKINRSDNNSSSDSVLNNTLYELKDIDASKVKSECMSLPPEIIDKCHEVTNHMQHASTLSKEDWDTLECYNSHPSKRNSLDNNNVRVRIAQSAIHQNIDDSEPPILEPNEIPQSSKIVHGDTSKTNSVILKITRKKGNTLSRNEKRTINLKRKKIIRVQQNDSTSRSIWSSKIEQNLAMERKMAGITNLRKLQCLLCKRKFTSMTSLRRHIAIHIGWYRYCCKLCDFKCFFKCDCVVHCNKMHNAQNNHAIMDEIVIEIPQDEHRRNENIVTSVTDVKKKTNGLDDADKTALSLLSASTSQSEVNKPDNADKTASSLLSVSTSQSQEVYENFSCSSDTTACVAGKDEEAATTDSTTKVPMADTDRTATICTNLEEYMENRTLGKLDVDSDLKRMVMEVIFGSSDAYSEAKQANSDKKLSNNSNEVKRDAHLNDHENGIASSDDTELAYCAITDGSKSQRPMRKRIKPLSKDFIYDLKDIQFRKESWKSPSSFQLGKSSTKPNLNLCDSEILTNARKKAKLFNRASNSY